MFGVALESLNAFWGARWSPISNPPEPWNQSARPYVYMYRPCAVTNAFLIALSGSSGSCMQLATAGHPLLSVRPTRTEATHTIGHSKMFKAHDLRHPTWQLSFSPRDIDPNTCHSRIETPSSEWGQGGKIDRQNTSCRVASSPF